MRKQQRPPAPTQFAENSDKWTSQYRLLELRKFERTMSSPIDDWAYRDFLELTM